MSNESKDFSEVYFDDFRVRTAESYIVQQTDYYAYGLISRNWNRLGEKATLDLFQSKTYNEATRWYDFHARQYDAALGRWFGVDPQNQFASPYLAMGNNPVIGIDPDGEFVLTAMAIGAAVGYLSGRASGLRGWDLAGFTFASGVIGGISAGIGGAVKAGVASAFSATANAATVGAASGAAGGFAGGFTSGFMSASLNGGNPLKGGLMAGAFGGVLGGITGGYSGYKSSLKTTASTSTFIISPIDLPQLPTFGDVNFPLKAIMPIPEPAYSLLGRTLEEFVVTGAKLNFDINKAVLTLIANTNPRSMAACAKFVRYALEAGGINTKNRPPTGYAKDYGPYLDEYGFKRLHNIHNYVPVKGDIAVINSYSGGSKAGHIQMFDGKNWRSDFLQRNFWPGSGYRVNKPSFKIYRW